MKIYLLTDDPYHDNEIIFGAYTSEEKARAAAAEYVVDPENNWTPCMLVVVEIDMPCTPIGGVSPARQDFITQVNTLDEMRTGPDSYSARAVVSSGMENETTSAVTHSPLPWHLERRHSDPETRKFYLELLPVTGGALGEWSSQEICGFFGADEGGIQAANAELVVRCVNSHAALVAALEDSLRVTDSLCHAVFDVKANHSALIDPRASATLKQARAALAAAKETRA